LKKETGKTQRPVVKKLDDARGKNTFKGEQKSVDASGCVWYCEEKACWDGSCLAIREYEMAEGVSGLPRKRNREGKLSGAKERRWPIKTLTILGGRNHRVFKGRGDGYGEC